LLRAIQIRVYPGEQSGFIAECMDLPVVSQGETIDIALENVRQAHKLAHLKYRNHSDKFWELVGKMVSDLEKYHSALDRLSR
jgi:predicted RNase H-like HicB family nuclease